MKFSRYSFIVPALLGAALLPQSAVGDASGYAKVRIENELRLKVPNEKAEEVWKYLNERYATGENYLTKRDPKYSTKFSDEAFTDRYFDDYGYTVYKGQGGLRHRSRIVSSDPTNRKNGRELIQLKLQREADNVNRSELKFKVEPPEIGLPGEFTPYLMVSKKQRPEYVKALSERGIDYRDVFHVLTIKQRRRRVYVNYNGEPFGSITVDEAVTNRWWKQVKFTEVEFEPTEIGYTNATPEQREKMSAVTREMKDDIRARFPEAVEDQTPKYKKMYDAFNEQYLLWPLALRLGIPVEALLSIVSAGAAAWAWHAISKRRSRSALGKQQQVA